MKYLIRNKENGCMMVKNQQYVDLRVFDETPFFKDDLGVKMMEALKTNLRKSDKDGFSHIFVWYTLNGPDRSDGINITGKNFLLPQLEQMKINLYLLKSFYKMLKKIEVEHPDNKLNFDSFKPKVSEKEFLKHYQNIKKNHIYIENEENQTEQFVLCVRYKKNDSIETISRYYTSKKNLGRLHEALLFDSVKSAEKVAEQYIKKISTHYLGHSILQARLVLTELVKQYNEGTTPGTDFEKKELKSSISGIKNPSISSSKKTIL